MNYLVLGILTVLFVGKCVNGVKIQFFRSKNFIDLHYESHSTKKCSNVRADKKDISIFSIKTDTCLMIYDKSNCRDSFSRKFDLNNSLGWRHPVGSFHICNEDIGGHQLKIDITKYLDLTNSGVLESYRDVCTCINVPQYVQNMSYWSINNYGNDLLVYYQPNCSENKWGAEHVPAGLWCPGSACMHDYKQIDSLTNPTYKIQSIGPNPNSTYFKTNCNLALQKDMLSLEEKHDQHFFRLGAKERELEEQIETILTENQAMKNKTVKLESKLKNYISLEDSIEKLKNDFDNLVLKLDHTLSKRGSDLQNPYVSGPFSFQS